MNQDDAAVMAAALGIAGALVGALGGAFLQGRNTRQQVREQEAASVRYQLREERRAAFAAVLDQCDEVVATLDPVIEARVSPDWKDDADHRGLWAPTLTALRLLRRSVSTVMITGPDAMAELATEIHEASSEKIECLRAPGLRIEERFMQFARASTRLEEAYQGFIDEARATLDVPGR